MKIELNDQIDVQANRRDERNDIDKNVQKKINERGEKRPKNVGSNLTKLAFLAEQRNRPSSQPRWFKTGDE